MFISALIVTRELELCTLPRSKIYLYFRNPGIGYGFAMIVQMSPMSPCSRSFSSFSGSIPNHFFTEFDFKLFKLLLAISTVLMTIDQPVAYSPKKENAQNLFHI